MTTVDGTAQVVTITINGTNDAAIIRHRDRRVTEAGTAAPGTPTAVGTLTATDVDNAANAFAAVTSPTASASGYGTYTLTAAGVWTYTLSNANGAVQALNVGAKLTDTFTVTTVDGTAQLVTITINGTNDAAVITGTPRAPSSRPAASATARRARRPRPEHLTDNDVDNPPNTFTAVSSPTASDRRLRHLHDDSGWRVDLHARQQQQRRAGAQCRRHADRHLHGEHASTAPRRW